jgi:hypothetical protein
MKNIGLPKGVAYACLAETIVLALEGRFENFTVGRAIEWEKVREIYKLGLKHGMKLAEISGVNGVFSDEDIERVRELALRHLQLHLHQALLRGQQRALRVQHLQVNWLRRCDSAGRPGAGARPPPAACALLCVTLRAQRCAAGQAIGHFAEGGLDGLFVLRHRDVAARLHGCQVGLVAAGVEQRLQQLRGKAPRGVLEQVAQVRAGRAHTAGQRDARKEGRTRRTDVGVGGDQLLFGLRARRGAAAARPTAGRRAGSASACSASGRAGGNCAGSGWPSSSTRALRSCARWRIEAALPVTQLHQASATLRAWPGLRVKASSSSSATRFSQVRRPPRPPG